MLIETLLAAGLTFDICASKSSWREAMAADATGWRAVATRTTTRASRFFVWTHVNERGDVLVVHEKGGADWWCFSRAQRGEER